MIHWLAEMGTFLVQLVAVALVVVLVALAILRAKSGTRSDTDRLRLEDLSLRFERRQKRLNEAIAPTKKRGRWRRLPKVYRRKADPVADGGSDERKPTLWVIDFHGDLKASGVGRLAQETTALLSVAEQNDEIVVRLESPGGLVHTYGLAAAQLDRLRQAGLSTTVCVDAVAASGGYLMACNADRIRVAPFAVIGSIGVVAQVPNIHRLLKRHDIDVELMTAGRYKRTLTVLGENTDEGRDKFRSDLEMTHDKFKRYVADRRPSLAIDEVATGEIWYGTEAVDKGLADEVGTSEDYLMAAMKRSRVMSLRLERPKPLAERLGFSAAQVAERLVERVEERLDAARWEKR